MYTTIVDFIGITPDESLIGFIGCLMLIMFVLFQIIQLLYSIIKGD